MCFRRQAVEGTKNNREMKEERKKCANSFCASKRSASSPPLTVSGVGKVTRKATKIKLYEYLETELCSEELGPRRQCARFNHW